MLQSSSISVLTSWFFNRSISPQDNWIFSLKSSSITFLVKTSIKFYNRNWLVVEVGFVVVVVGLVVVVEAGFVVVVVGGLFVVVVAGLVSVLVILVK